ncbi:hypothetical protein GCM10007884_48030 [Methylobacterium brachythecii]|nr:hypothetical protein GCM10007884_48030 [Methylobacterium brachythecii]
MGYVTFFSEKGIPHAGILIEYNSGSSEWLGFFPNPYKGRSGAVMLDDRESEVDWYVRYPGVDNFISKVRNFVVADYYSEIYQMLTSDCVTFAMDFAEQFGLAVPPRPHFFPSTLVYGIYRDNGHIGEYGQAPFPWKVKRK